MYKLFIFASRHTWHHSINENREKTFIVYNFMSSAEMICTYIIHATAVALLISTIKCQPPSEQASLDDLIKEIFTMSPNITYLPGSESPPIQSNRGPDIFTQMPPPLIDHIPVTDHVLQPVPNPTVPEPTEENVSEIRW